MKIVRKIKRKLRKIKKQYLIEKRKKALRKKYKERIIRTSLNEKTLYPDLERKSKLRRSIEIFCFVITGKTGIARNYNMYGLDIKNFHNSDDYIDGKYFHNNTAVRNAKRKKYNYIMADKFLTYCYLTRINPDISPKVYNLLSCGKSIMEKSKYKTAQEIINSLKNNDKLCFKLAYGSGGTGFFLVEKENDQIIINKGKCTLEDFYKNIGKQKYIVQEFIKQHEKIANLNAASLNTIRMTTVYVNGKYKYLGSMLRCGISNTECVDNACHGGIFIGINDDGTLKEDGYFMNAPTSKIHPSSKVVFKDYEIPYFKEAIKMAEHYHNYFPGMTSIGWDIAITDKGPMIIELNSGWGTVTVQMCNEGFKKRIIELYNDNYKNIIKALKTRAKNNNK